MKNKIIILRIMIFVLIAAIGCRKDITSKNEQAGIAVIKDTLAISDAVKYLGTSLKQRSNVITFKPSESVKNLSIGGNSISHQGIAYWKRAKSFNFTNFQVVEVPLIEENKVTLVYGFAGNNPIDSGKIRARSSFSRLLIFRKSKTDTLTKKIITYIPDLAYLKLHHYDASSNWLNKLNKDFSGFIEYKTWDQKVQFVLRIENGILIHRYAVTGSSTSSTTVSKTQSVTSNTVKTQAQTCFNYCSPIYQEICSGPFEGMDGQPVCVTTQIGQDCSDYCYDDSTDPTNPTPPSNPGIPVPGPAGGGAAHCVPNITLLPPNGTTDIQVGQLCVLKTMEWASKYFGGSVTVGQLLIHYAGTQGLSGAQMSTVITQDGIPSGDLETLVFYYFTTATTNSMYQAIDNGHVMMGTLLNFDGSGHEVLVTGYNNDGMMVYFDPQLGVYDTQLPSNFHNVIQLTGLTGN